MVVSVGDDDDSDGDGGEKFDADLRAIELNEEVRLLCLVCFAQRMTYAHAQLDRAGLESDTRQREDGEVCQGRRDRATWRAISAHIPDHLRLVRDRRRFGRATARRFRFAFVSLFAVCILSI